MSVFRRLTLDGDIAAFEHLAGKPCESRRWALEEATLSASSALRKSEGANARAAKGRLLENEDRAARDRVHDAIRGLQFVLSSWVTRVSGRLTKADEYALIDLLEIIRATVPLRPVKKAVALAILHLHNSGSQDAPASLQKPQAANSAADRFSWELELYHEMDDALQAVKGLRADEWGRWIGSIPFGKEAPPLAPLEDPHLRHCTTVTCSVWMLLHLLAEGASEHARKVSEYPACGPKQLFYRRKGQALPVYLQQLQQAQGEEVNLQEVLDVASLSTVSSRYDPFVCARTSVLWNVPNNFLPRRRQVPTCKTASLYWGRGCESTVWTEFVGYVLSDRVCVHCM